MKRERWSYEMLCFPFSLFPLENAFRSIRHNANVEKLGPFRDSITCERSELTEAATTVDNFKIPSINFICRTKKSQKTRAKVRCAKQFIIERIIDCEQQCENFFRIADDGGPSCDGWVDEKTQKKVWNSRKINIIFHFQITSLLCEH